MTNALGKTRPPTRLAGIASLSGRRGGRRHTGGSAPTDPLNSTRAGSSRPGRSFVRTSVTSRDRGRTRGPSCSGRETALSMFVNQDSAAESGLSSRREPIRQQATSRRARRADHQMKPGSEVGHARTARLVGALERDMPCRTRHISPHDGCPGRRTAESRTAAVPFCMKNGATRR